MMAYFRLRDPNPLSPRPPTTPTKKRTPSGSSSIHPPTHQKLSDSPNDTKTFKLANKTFKLAKDYEQKIDKKSRTAITELKQKYYNCFFPTTSPPTVDKERLGRISGCNMQDLMIMRKLIDVVGLMEMQFKSFIQFCLMIPRFKELSIQDQNYLCMESSMPVILVRTSYTYNRVTQIYGAPNGINYTKEDFLELGLPRQEFEAMWKLI